MAHLMVTTGVDEGCSFGIEQEVLRIGRSPQNDVVINDSAASRKHAELIKRDGQYYLRDLGSTHGTYVNDVRNNYEMLLSHNDIVRIGNTDLVFKLDDESAAIAPKKPGEDGTEVDAEAPTSFREGETIAFSLPTDSNAAGMGLSAHHLAMLSRVAEAIQSVFNIDELMETLIDTLFVVFEPDRGVILLLDEESGKLKEAVTRPAGETVRYSHTVLDHAISKRMSLLVSDIADDQRFSAAQSIMAQSIQSAICAPLVSKNKVLGVLYIDAQTRQMSYQKEDLALLNIIAANVSVAIENTFLIKDKIEAERLAALGVAVAGISHYVKNILTGMQGSSDLIEHGLKKNSLDMIRQSWPILQRSTQKTRSLVQDMLTYSKKREPEWKPGNLNDLLRDVYENQSARAEELDVALHLELDEALPESEFDPKTVHDTLLNLTGNAVEACQDLPGATVRLVTAQLPERGLLRVSVIDDGPGIPPDIAERIFEPFFSTKGASGTGLGLALARKCAEEHGGDLLLETEVGKGTSFHLQLPLERPGQQG